MDVNGYGIATACLSASTAHWGRGSFGVTGLQALLETLIRAIYAVAILDYWAAIRPVKLHEVRSNSRRESVVFQRLAACPRYALVKRAQVNAHGHR